MRVKARKLYLAMGLAMVAMLVAAGAVYAAFTFDPATGKGFVGKGDVQLIYGWNNQQLQQNANLVQFRATTTSDTTWTCSRPAPTPNDLTREITQQRTATTTTQGVVSKVDRVRNQITGFTLTGYSGTPTTTTDGPAVGSCPANPSGFTFDEGSQQSTPGTTVLQVSTDGTTWYDLVQPTTTV